VRLAIKKLLSGNFVKLVLISSFALIMVSCSQRGESNNLSLKSQQYFVQGEKLYIAHCSNCHQTDGSGLGLLYPPVNKSDFMDKNFETVVCLMKNGVEGELIVNGKQFDKPMPGIPSLTDLEITEISTYIYNKWGNRRDSITLQQVSAILRECKTSN
jgi:mono/diheme cytochrome c family protein